jgi:ArsR family transcriptional regulator, arsenate/arsenite/antimonite-responsive transcriptional repressor
MALSGESIREFIKTMKSLSDPNRARIIKLLQKHELCVCDITASLGLAQSTTSKHLKILVEAGLISFTKEGLWIKYRLADGTANRYAASMLGNFRHWLGNDLDVAAMVSRLPEDRWNSEQSRPRQNQNTL